MRIFRILTIISYKVTILSYKGEFLSISQRADVSVPASDCAKRLGRDHFDVNDVYGAAQLPLWFNQSQFGLVEFGCR